MKKIIALRPLILPLALALLAGCGGPAVHINHTQVAVPNVVGETQAAATSAVTGAGLVLGTVTSQSSTTVPSGSVISESPAAGTQVSAGSAVNIVVSAGVGQVAVPNVVGQTQAAATTAITGAGLVLGTVTSQSSSTAPSGSVISESPAAGTQVSTGSAVNLVVSSGTGATAPLSAANLNLIFVVSSDLAFQATGDVSPQTASLTNQGLNRSLLMAPYLQQSVLGAENVTAIYALEPMTHLQTASNYPDMAALETIQQFALLNHITLTSGGTAFEANSFPLNASYAPAPVPLPSGVAKPVIGCTSCQGLDFEDQDGDNETLVDGIITAGEPGFYVFSAPWETASALIAKINQSHSYNLNLPASYAGPDNIYAISVASGTASLLTFNSNLSPPSTYPTLPSPVSVGNACTAAPFNITVTGGAGGAVIPAHVNTSETLYIIRHVEAHPASSWDDGNYICAGQWRALDLPNALPVALHGKISPQLVYSSDPAQAIQGSATASGQSVWSYVRPALTVEPYAIANNLPYYLAADFDFEAQNPPQPATQASDFFFTGGNLSNQAALLAWEHVHIPTTVNALLASYYPNGGAPTAPAWADDDYDSIWTVTLDPKGNLTVNNKICEGIVSASLPVSCPAF